MRYICLKQHAARILRCKKTELADIFKKILRNFSCFSCQSEANNKVSVTLKL